jgi:hypothetical protein
MSNLNIIKVKEKNNVGIKIRAILGIMFFMIPFGYELLWIYLFNEYNNHKISVEKFSSFLPVFINDLNTATWLFIISSVIAIILIITTLKQPDTLLRKISPACLILAVPLILVLLFSLM